MSTSTFEGQPLVEVFCVCFHDDEAPAGTVSVYDGKRGQIIYSGSPIHKPSTHQAQRSGGVLPLTGPYRAISADGCVAIVLDLHHRLHDNAASPPTSAYVAEIHLDVYDDATRYDEAITYDDGQAAVTYALLSEAAEAVVEVRLLRQRPSSTVVRKVVARTDIGEVVLFNDKDGGAVGGSTEETGIIPLARSVVAVPLTSSLTVEVELVVDGDGDAVTESVVFVPKLGCEEVYPRPTFFEEQVAAVEVKVSWLD